MAQSLFFFFYHSVQNLIKDSFDEYQCLNESGRSEMVCAFVSDVVVPPLTIFSLLKYGIKGAQKMYPVINKTVKVFSKQNRKLLYGKAPLKKTKDKPAISFKKILGVGSTGGLLKQISDEQIKQQIKGVVKTTS